MEQSVGLDTFFILLGIVFGCYCSANISTDYSYVCITNINKINFEILDVNYSNFRLL